MHCAITTVGIVVGGSILAFLARFCGMGKTGGFYGIGGFDYSAWLANIFSSCCNACSSLLLTGERGFTGNGFLRAKVRSQDAAIVWPVDNVTRIISDVEYHIKALVMRSVAVDQTYTR